MKKIKQTILIILMVLIPEYSNASDISEINISESWNHYVKEHRDFFCSILGLNHLDPFKNNCGRPATTPFGINEYLGLIAGRAKVNSYGCGDQSFNESAQKQFILDKQFDKTLNVALLGDSLTDFGGGSYIWNLYLAGGKYQAIAMGAAGATSSAWREHFENCEAGRPDFGFPPPALPENTGRLKLPPRSIMMIGGNDFVVFKGILQPMWWLVDIRHNSTLFNIERIITHHHKGNNGCGDNVPTNDDGSCKNYAGGPEINYLDWGRGRLFVSLGNIPAVSIDPTDPKYFFLTGGLFYGLGLMDPLVYDKNSANTIGKNKYQIMDFFPYLMRRLLDTYVDVAFGAVNRLFKTRNANEAWASREMHILQNKIDEVQHKRTGFVYIHMYSSFRDTAANQRGCYWCGDKIYWYGDAISLNDGRHITHTRGYSNWATQVVPFMAATNMESPIRTDSYGPPGAEVTTGSDQADDWWLIIVCFLGGYCRM